jgi:Ohr subfamily peroxiredoxin
MRRLIIMALFTSKATAVGGRSGHIKSEDGVLDFDIIMPNAKKDGETGTNPEQLFAAGYAACFGGALELAAKKQNIDMTSEIEGQVSLLKDESDGGYKIGVTLVIDTKDLDKETAEKLVHAAHEFCPYSKATRGNVDVKLELK